MPGRRAPPLPAKIPSRQSGQLVATRLRRGIREPMMHSQSIPLARLAVGLGQGVALWYLQRTFDAESWPATDAFVFAPLLTVATLVPIIVVAGLGHMRPRTLAVWTVVASVICAGLAVCDIFRDPIGAMRA